MNHYRAIALADIHGDVENTENAVKFAITNKIDFVLVAGDLGSNDIWPVTEKTTEDEKKLLKNKGYFPCVVSEKEYELFEKSVTNIGKGIEATQEERTFVEKLVKKGRKQPEFKKYVKDSFFAVLDVLSRLRKKKIFTVLGEQDFFGAEIELDTFAKNNSTIVNIHNNIHFIDEKLAIIGISRVVPTKPRITPLDLIPWRSSYLSMLKYFNTQQEQFTDISEHNIGYILSEKLQQVPEDGKAIILSHIPPYETGADMGLFKSYGEKDAYKAFFIGSHSIRLAMKKKKVILNVCGHVHTCPGVTEIHDTPVLNPGQLRSLKTPIVNFRIYRDRFAKNYVPKERFSATGSGGAVIDIGKKIRIHQFSF